MLSLGKLQLDDNKIDLKIRSLIECYFIFKDIEPLIKNEEVQHKIETFVNVYKILKDSNYLVNTYNKLNNSRKTHFSKFKQSLNRYSNKDEYYDSIHFEMDQIANEIFIKINSLELKDQEAEIKKLLETWGI